LQYLTVALSPADFYAYSRATGVPVPDSDEERARMAGDVVNFRRNQLRVPVKEEDQGFNLTNALGIGAAALGLGAGAYGLRRALTNRAATAARTAEVPVTAQEVSQYQKGAPKYSENVANLAALKAEELPLRTAKPTAAPEPSKIATPTASSQTPDPWQDSKFTPRSFIENSGAVAPTKDLTGIQKQAGPSLISQAYDAVESGIGQEEQRIDVKIQRHPGGDVPDVDIPQVEDTFESYGLLPSAQRTLTRQEKEAKIFARLETEALKLGKTSHTATEPFGPEGPRIPPGPLLYPSQVPLREGQIVKGVSSPTREFMSAFAQGDPRVQDVVRRENVEGFERIKTYGGVKGASLMEGDTFDPLTGEMLSRGEQISGTGSTRQVLNPAWSDAYKTYWERRAIELPHTLDDYEARKAAGKLNYQLPVEERDPANNAQMYEKWDKQTSEALRNIYETTVGDTPQYITEVITPKTSLAGTETQYRGQAGSTGETTGAPVPILNPKGILFGAQSKGLPFVSVGETSLARAAKDQSYASGKVLRFKGEGGATKLDVMPLSYDAETDVILPSNTPGATVRGKAKVTRTALVPLQKAVLIKDPETGVEKTQLVNFSIDLTAPVGTRTGIDESGREVAKAITLQEAVNDLRNYHGKDYASLNSDVDALLKSTHKAYNVPVMTRTPFEKYDEARNEFIRMLGGTQYEAKEKGFLTSVEGNTLPYTGPMSPGSKGNRAENVINARTMLLQAGVPLKKISDYLPDTDEMGTTPTITTESTRDVGIPRPDIMSTGTNLGVRTSTYERISPNMGGAVTSQLRNLVAKGAKVENINGNVIYSTELGEVSYPENKLIQSLKSENQDAPTIAALVGRSIATEKTDPMAVRREPSVLAQERANESGYYYNEEGQRLAEPTSTPWGSFTGAARFAAGPASVASMGGYPQGGGRVGIKTSPINLSQLQERNEFALTANLTPGGTVSQGGLLLGGGLGAIPAGIESLPSESATIARYGVTGGQLKQVGDVLMARAAYKQGQQPGPTRQGLPSSMRLAETPQRLESPYHVYGPLPPSSNLQQQLATTLKNTPINKEVIARDQATSRHLANYIASAAQRLEGPETWQGDVKLKGKGQNALRPYQAPSEAMLQQLMRAYR